MLAVIPSASMRSKHRRAMPGVHAVARFPEAAEAERVRLDHARRIHGRTEQRGARKVVARIELELAQKIAPIGRELGESLVPNLDERRRRGECRSG